MLTLARTFFYLFYLNSALSLGTAYTARKVPEPKNHFFADRTSRDKLHPLTYLYKVRNFSRYSNSTRQIVQYYI